MRADIVEIPHTIRESQRRLGLAKGLRDAVADHLRHRWPAGTAKFSARAYNLSLDRAREAVAGRASLTTLEQIIKVGGWPVALSILADVIGTSIAQYIASLRERHEENGSRLSAMGWGLRALSADRGRDDPDVASVFGGERRAVDRRQTGRRGGEA